MPPNVVYRITTSPATTSATFVGMPVRVDTTDPEAAIWEEVRQNRERILSTAVKILDFSPNRRPTTSGIVTAMVSRILGAK